MFLHVGQSVSNLHYVSPERGCLSPSSVCGDSQFHIQTFVSSSTALLTFFCKMFWRFKDAGFEKFTPPVFLHKAKTL